jgi:hypothetical protein
MAQSWSDFFERPGSPTAYPRSIVKASAVYALVADGARTRQLAIVSADPTVLDAFEGESQGLDLGGRPATLKLGALTAGNAAALRSRLDFLVPRPLGLSLSAGCGDRLGLATPGHLRAFRQSSMSPIVAQQSMRENSRTGRSTQQVVDDAMWGVFQEGWRDGYGADADHLKTTADIDACAPAGYTFYTIDPSEHVDNAANDAPAAVLSEKLATLPWDELDTTWNDTRARLARPVDLGSFSFVPTEEQLLRAVAKYARVVTHTARMQKHLEQAMAGRPFELEMSVDESETVTTLAEHVYIASELKRLGVTWVSLAPRYVGEFEKGVDYRGNLVEFERTFAEHFAVAQAFGPYKLSLHSGSDKFSIFPIAARVAGHLIHLKTSGTSYLEALRTIAETDSGLLREIARFARDRYAHDRIGYHVSAQVEHMADPDTISDADLPALLDQFDAREVLHVTFGSIIQNGAMRTRLLGRLREHEEAYWRHLETHLGRHFAPFAQPHDVPPRRVMAR